MRIGLFTDVYEPYISGVVVSVKMLKKELERQGHKVYVVTPNLDGIKTTYDDKNRVLRVGSIPSGIYKDIRIANTYPLKTIKKIEKWNLDIIHIHTELGIGTLGKKLSKKNNIPLVYTYHTVYEDAVSYVTKGIFDKAGKKALKHITKSFCKTIEEIIAPGEKVYKLLKNKYEVETNITVVPNGIEVERFRSEKFSEDLINNHRERLGIQKDDFVILYLGRIAMEKDIAFLIAPMKQILKHNSKVKLLIVGGGPEEEELHKLVKKHKLEGNVILTGAVPWDKVPEYYQIGTVFATASTFENHSMTVIEAMAAALPVICINDLGHTTTVMDNKNGRVFKNKREYITIIKELISTPRLVEEMKTEALLTSNLYSEKKHGENVLKVYEKALGRPIDKKFIRIKKAINALKRKGD